MRMNLPLFLTGEGNRSFRHRAILRGLIGKTVSLSVLIKTFFWSASEDLAGLYDLPEGVSVSE